MLDIQETTNYDIFKMVKGNRAVHFRHVKDLISSLGKKNMLQEHPILVNGKMEVIDGQHRLLAAKALDLPVPYVIVKETGIDEVLLLNAHNRQWILKDYLESFVNRGAKDYIQFKEFIDTYDISITTGLYLISTTWSGEAAEKFRQGSLKIEPELLESAKEVAESMADLKEYTAPRVAADRNLMRALMNFKEDHNYTEFMTKLVTSNEVITKSLTIGDYMRQLERIYGE